MAGDTKSEVWLTFALTKADVANALTLCYSLKRVLTFRKIGVILSNKLSTPLKMSLHQSFDYLFYLEEGRNTVELKEADFVKLFPLTLKAFEMCVFLPPNTLAVNNSDRIFDECRNLRFSGYLLQESAGLDMFVMRPSWNVFENLTKGLLKTGGMDMEKYIRKWTKANNQTCQPLSDKYNHLLSVHGFPQPGEQAEVLLVNTRDIRLDMNAGELGMFTKVSQLSQ
ncbi:unnamed protein product [Orchesella dallaii]|uniref:Uncharacterized protein n=1 Tax=Orchesella dallaii TaxID=48710 RepID=A0ABP1RYK6_9HEXA